jgi:demethylmenaquinone methyltransferase/2-methoxy-6-polyprenyl-1,4-benzoquinol methylase
MSVVLPDTVTRAMAVARRAGFSMSCAPETGRLLAVLAAAVPHRGRILELGTGVGVGTAWLCHGLGPRDDVDVVTVDNDRAVVALATEAAWPRSVRFIVGDAVDVSAREGAFDLIFADAQGGKWDGLDVTINALRAGGHLLVDDMTPTCYADTQHESKIAEVRDRILEHPDLISVPIAWSTGLILSTRRRT